jgi:hypothetical protein
MRLSRLALAALALLALSACAPQITQGLPDEPTSEASGSGPDRASDPQAGSPSIDAPSQNLSATVPSVSDQALILAKYSNLDPKHEVPSKLLAAALQYFDDHAASIQNKAYVSVIDFSLPSSKHRFWIIDMATGAVFSTPVAHGKNSDKNNDGIAEAFSNTPNSDMSSLGVYLTAETYHGSHPGLSLRLDGKSTTNSNVRSRAIVIHGADYVQDLAIKQGRSWGCPAVPQIYRDKIIGMIKGGSVIYAGQSL